MNTAALTTEHLQRLRAIVESGTPLARNTVLQLIERVKYLAEQTRRHREDWAIAYARGEVAEATIAKVRELHTKQLGGSPTGDFADVCSCGVSYWPCPTIDALGETDNT